MKDVNWRKQKGSNYEAEFKNKGSELGVTMDSIGKLKKTELEMKVSDLSKAIVDYIGFVINGYLMREIKIL